LSDFQRGQIFVARLVVVSVNKTATFFRCIQSMFPRLWRHTQIMGRHHQLSGTVVENQN